MNNKKHVFVNLLYFDILYGVKIRKCKKEG